MSRLLQIAQLGNSVLRQIAGEIHDLSTPAVLALQEDMLATMLDTKGVGIAAPQVYVSQRGFIFSSATGPGRPDAPVIETTFVANPEIIWRSDEKVKGWEVCLSIPGIRGLVPRHASIKVRFATANGTMQEESLSGFPARVFQHEYDHLDGIVYLDRLETNRDIITEKEFQKLVK